MREALGCPDPATAGVVAEDYRSALARGRCASSPAPASRAARRAQERELLVRRSARTGQGGAQGRFADQPRAGPTGGRAWRCADIGLQTGQVAGAGARLTAGCGPQQSAAHSGVRGRWGGAWEEVADMCSGVHTSTTSTGESPALTPALQSFSDNFPLLQSWGSSSPR